MENKKIINYIRFYSLIYGIILLIISLIWIIGTIFWIATSTIDLHPSNIFLGPLSLVISCLIAGLLLMITFYGLTHSKPYARLAGIFGSSLAIIVLVILSLIYNISITSETLMPAIFIIIIPSCILIVLHIVSWKHLKF